MNGEAQTLSIYRLMTSEQRLLRCVETARKALQAGVTSMRDLGSSGRNAIEVRDAIAKGMIEGPAVVAMPARRSL